MRISRVVGLGGGGREQRSEWDGVCLGCLVHALDHVVCASERV